MSETGDLLHVVTSDQITPRREALGRLLVWGSFGVLVLTFAVLGLGRAGVIGLEVADLAARALCLSVLGHLSVHCAGGAARRAGQADAVHPARGAVRDCDGDLSADLRAGDRVFRLEPGRRPTGASSTVSTICVQMWGDPFYWNALKNMVYYTLAILVEYAIAFGLALILASEIRARKFFRVAFLLPLMLSPVAVSWMVGKSMMEIRFGPLARLARWLGWDTAVVLWLAGSGAGDDHGDGRLDVHSVHDDHDPGRAAGDPARGAGGREGGRRQRLARVLGGDVSADAAGRRSPRS